MSSIAYTSDHLKKLEQDMQIMRQRIEDYKLLRSQYLDFLNQLPCYTDERQERTQEMKRPPKTIWSCWFQGYQNAPELVKTCKRSVDSMFTGYQKIFLTGEQFADYITLDSLIIDKWRKGIISNTAFSNIVRLELLITHGGLWLDSTVYCTGRTVPDYISQSRLFVYRSWKWLSGDVRPISTWFISAGKNHPMLKTARDLLIHYWHTNDSLVTYHIFQMFFQMVIEKYPLLWQMTPKYSNLPPHMMQFELDCPYCPTRFGQLAEMSDFHKLTYRLPEETLADNHNLYNFILNIQRQTMSEFKGIKNKVAAMIRKKPGSNVSSTLTTTLTDVKHFCLK